MKKYIVKIFVLFCIVAVVDVTLGYCFGYLFDNAKGGMTAESKNISNSITDEVLVFGSSRAIHHYDPMLIGDSLGVGCYNCGKERSGIILMYGRYKLMAERYTPKVILYEITPGFDIYKHRWKDVVYLSYFYDNPAIDSIFWRVDKSYRVKMMSKAYQYNTNPLALVRDYVHPVRSFNKGYSPYEGVMDYEPVLKKRVYGECDSVKLYYLERLVQDCKAGGTKLIFCASPEYKATDDDEYAVAIELAEKYDIPFWNFHCDTTFTLHREYFSDSYHLSRQGATEYSKRIVRELRSTNFK